MSVLKLQSGIIYGPVNSRRLGRSLGINLLPCRYKLCSFDCVYCHYGRTEVKTLRPDPAELPLLADVMRALREGLGEHPDIDYITFSGNGEPSLHPDFPAIVAGVKALRDEVIPSAHLAILSNSSTVQFSRVRQAIALIDVPIMKLDAGSAEMLARIDRPAREVSFEGVVEGLSQLPHVILQSVLVEGRVSNAKGEALDDWMAAVARVKPQEVQIYSTDRPVAEAAVEKVSPEVLQGIAEEATRRTGIPVRAYWA